MTRNNTDLQRELNADHRQEVSRLQARVAELEEAATPEVTDAAKLALAAFSGAEYDRTTVVGGKLGQAEDALRAALEGGEKPTTAHTPQGDQ